MKASRAKWRMYKPAPPDFLHGGPVQPLLMQVLYNRGARSVSEASAFLDGEDAVKENPYRLQDMTKAVGRILQAIERGETICVYGDFDADGVTSTVLMVTALKAAGARVGAYIPDRVDEGYGLHAAAIEERIAPKAQLLVTVDCGIRGVQEVELANRLGLDVIISDHHHIGPQLPPALAVINPRRQDCPSPFKELAGVGVAYRLAQGVVRALARQAQSRLDAEQIEALEQDLLVLVAIGTVADVLPLTGENRSLVRRGLEQLNRTQKTGILALLEQASLRPGTVDSTAISFRIGPRINAAGRLEHAGLAYELLRTPDLVKAKALADRLDQLNRQRQALTEQAHTAARAQLEGQAEGFIQIARSPEFQPGIVGLVAGKLAEDFYRPALVIWEGKEECRGSARSIREFHITQALDEVGELLVRHGGHQMAAGFTVRPELFPALQEALQAIARRELAAYDDLRPTLTIDAQTRLDEINWGLLGQLARLEPTGEGNPSPLFGSRNCRVRRTWAVGQDRHLKLVLDAGPGTPAMDAIAFRQAHWGQVLGEGSRVDLVFHVEANEWQGDRRLQLNVQDIREVGSDVEPA